MSSLENQISPSDAQLIEYARTGWLGPISILNRRECCLLNSYLESPNRPSPLDWPKGLAPSDRVIYDIANSPKVTSLVRSILKDSFILWGAHIVEREPGKAHIWHTDIETAESAGNAVTIWISLKNTSAKSSLSLISGSQKLGVSLQRAAAEKGLEREHRDDISCYKLASEISDECTLVQSLVADGQALLFDGRLWHGSFNKQEKATRRSLLLQFSTSDFPVRIPDLTQLDWPFKFRGSPKPPVVLMSGTDSGGVNRVVSPPAEWPYSSKALANKIYSIPRPLNQDIDRGWQPTRFFNGSSPVMRKLSAHASILEPGCSPHKPHSHYDEELLVILEGEAELIIANSAQDPDPQVEPVSAGDIAFYPACQFHTIRCSGKSPVSYFMFRWNAAVRDKEDILKTSVFRNPWERCFNERNDWSTSRVFEGKTNHLDKLHLHFSRVRKSGGYAPHRDEYDVAILLLDGAVTTLGKVVHAPAVIFHPARALHGLRGHSEKQAFYLVIEFHGKYIDELTQIEKLRWQLYSFIARIRQSIRWRLAALKKHIWSKF